MKTPHTAYLWAIFLVICCPPLMGQEATEQFIPIGKSPGLSGVTTVVGHISSLSIENETITVADSTGQTYSCTCTAKTRFWKDRSGQNQSNVAGKLSDCSKGRLVEIKFVDNDREKGKIDWIKIKISE